MARFPGRILAILVIGALGIVGPGCAMAGPGVPAAGRTLDAFHTAAAEADEQAYFELFAPDGVFLGTDASERWTVEEFRAYAHPHFAKGKGWAYVPRARHVLLSPDGQIAWFDERLTHASYGELRGAGVLRAIDGQWRVAQYNLLFTVPNDKAKAVVALIKAPAPTPPTPVGE